MVRLDWQQAPGGVGLDPSAADDLTSPNQLHPVHASTQL